MDIGITIRKEVLTTSLIIESLTSSFLAGLLGINNIKNSYTLGNQGSCLSLSQKVDLLIDMGALSITNRNKFRIFMEIRNQFMHNLSATNYEKCFSFLNGRAKNILDAYPQPINISREEQLKNATVELSTEVTKLTSELIIRVKEKFQKDVESKVSQKSNQAFKLSIKLIEKKFDDYFENEFKRDKKFSAKRLKGFGKAFSKIIFSLWKTNFDNLHHPDINK